MTDMQRAMAVAARADASQLERAYALAVAAGGANTRCAERPERAHGALRLLTLATLRLPDLALQAYLLDVAECAGVEALQFELQAVWEIAAGALRLAHRALEAHADAVGYEPAAWVGHALGRAREALAGIEPAPIEGTVAITQEQVRRVAVALTRAAAATAEDAMRVPDETATALAHLLTLFMITSEAITS
jgi:hypothetical protein